MQPPRSYPCYWVLARELTGFLGGIMAFGLSFFVSSEASPFVQAGFWTAITAAYLAWPGSGKLS